MTDPIVLSVVSNLGVKFLEHGITFLCDEAGRLLDRFQEKRRKKATGGQAEDVHADDELKTVQGELPEFVKGDLKREINFDQLALVEREMQTLKEEIEIYQQTYHKFRKRVAQKGDDATLYDQERLEENARLFYEKGNALKILVEKVYGETIDLVEFP